MLRCIRFVFLIAVCSMLPGMAENNPPKIQKSYVSLDDLIFNESGIFFAFPIDGVEQSLASIHHDEHGFFYFAKPKKDKEEKPAWICPHCNTSNAGEFCGGRCWYCGRLPWEHQK